MYHLYNLFIDCFIAFIIFLPFFSLFHFLKILDHHGQEIYTKWNQYATEEDTHNSWFDQDRSVDCTNLQDWYASMCLIRFLSQQRNANVHHVLHDQHAISNLQSFVASILQSFLNRTIWKKRSQQIPYEQLAWRTWCFTLRKAKNCIRSW